MLITHFRDTSVVYLLLEFSLYWRLVRIDLHSVWLRLILYRIKDP